MSRNSMAVAALFLLASAVLVTALVVEREVGAEAGTGDASEGRRADAEGQALEAVRVEVPLVEDLPIEDVPADPKAPPAPEKPGVDAARTGTVEVILGNVLEGREAQRRLSLVRDGEFLASFYANEEGNARQDAVPAGRWLLVLKPADAAGRGACETHLREVDVVAGHTTYVDVWLEGGRVLRGAFPTRNAPDSVEVVLRQRDTLRVVARGRTDGIGRRDRGQDRSDADEGEGEDPLRGEVGYFEMTGLPPDLYVLEVSPGVQFHQKDGSPLPPEVLERVLRKVRIEVDLSAGDVTLEERLLTFQDFLAAGAVLREDEPDGGNPPSTRADDS